MYQAKKLPTSQVKKVIENINEYMISHPDKRHSKEVMDAYKSKEWENKLIFFEQLYMKNGESLHSISGDEYRLDNIVGIKKNTMKNLYKDFLDKNSDTRKELYKIFPEACPICDGPWGYVESHLDHVLPESVFPQYAITPVNLVRTCGRCNHKKLVKVGKEKFNQIINPYFKAIDFTDKLSCYIYIKSNEFIANVFLKPIFELNIDEQEYKIIQNFLETYQLLEMYNEVIEINLFSNLINLFMKKAYQKPSQSELKEILSEQLKCIDIDLINREKMVTKYFLKYLLLKSLIENYNEDIYRVFCEKVENKHTDLFP
ncbi:HNH endonuclease [Streptococcus parasuis]|uniref:HNH endonuclease n=1 Tax=Streptococcus TaxID=1301 RepID=UPI00240E22DB|nr:MULTISPECIES: HNH endonuclease signature motif containing protein [Streptococcus]WFB92275.1 HNH endonuclease [Streptococcus parasuis]WFB94212.1 HNH endonuclease [Streptococcus suis]WFB94257.1 HNH endonuclease [Streptococcus suis]